ncbi:MAG: DoxX family membrane protein [Acidobacteriota bacterium]|nr:DoxX family membrane protein [Acidobacteriota bacterium]
MSATPPPAAFSPGARSLTSWALLFARLVLGLIFFMAGWHKVFVLTPAGHVEKWFLPFRDTFLPTWSLWAAGLAIPFVELLAGALLLLGWRIRDALIALGAVLVVVTFGHLLKEPLYPFHEHVIPRLALLLFLLVMPRDEDRYSVEGILRSRTISRGGAVSES